MGTDYVLGIVLNALHTYLISKPPYEVNSITTPTLQIWKSTTRSVLMPESA